MIRLSSLNINSLIKHFYRRDGEAGIIIQFPLILITQDNRVSQCLLPLVPKSINMGGTRALGLPGGPLPNGRLYMQSGCELNFIRSKTWVVREINIILQSLYRADG